MYLTLPTLTRLIIIQQILLILKRLSPTPLIISEIFHPKSDFSYINLKKSLLHALLGPTRLLIF